MNSAAQGNTVLSLGRTNGSPGSNVITPVALASTDELVGLQIDFGFDPALVTPGTAVRGAALPAYFKVASSIVAPGRLRILLYSDSNEIIRDGGILSVPISVIGTIPQGQRGLQVIEMQLADRRGLNRTYALAPYVEILNPGNGSQLPLGNPVNVQVDAFAAVGALQNVQLFVDGNLTGTRTAAPWSFSYTPGERGTHNLLVVATDAGPIQAEASQALYILSHFDDWKAANFSAEQQKNPFVSSFSADPDRDGSVNGIEYLTGNLPLTAEPGSPLNTDMMKIDGEWYMTVTIHTPVSVDDILFTVFATDQLDRAGGDAPEAAVLVSEATDNGLGLITRTYRDPQPVSSGPRYMFIESAIRP